MTAQDRRDLYRLIPHIANLLTQTSCPHRRQSQLKFKEVSNPMRRVSWFLQPCTATVRLEEQRGEYREMLFSRHAPCMYALPREPLGKGAEICGEIKTKFRN